MPAGRLGSCVCAKTGGLLTPASSGPSILPYTSGLAGWWDAAYAASVTLNGSNVSQLADLSGNARHLVQAVPANQPAYGLAVRNGLNVLQFAGSQWVEPASAWAVTDLTIFMVFASTDNTAGTMLFGWTNYAADLQNRNANGATPANVWSAQAVPGPTGTGYLRTNNVAIDSAWHMWDVLRGSTVFDNHMDADVATWATPTGWVQGALTALQATGKPTVGSRGDHAVPMLGYIGEVIVYGAQLAPADRSSVRNYLRTKWGTP